MVRNHSELTPCRSCREFLPRKGPRQGKKVLEKLRAVQLHMAPGWLRPQKIPQIRLPSWEESSGVFCSGKVLNGVMSHSPGKVVWDEVLP